MGSDTPAHIQAGVPPLPWHMYQPAERAQAQKGQA